MPSKPKLPLLPLAGGAVVVAVGVSLLMNAWTAGVSDRQRADGAIADGHTHEHALTAFYDINDPAQVLLVPAAEAPNVTMHLTQADGAWTVRLDLVNFAFAGTDAGTEHVPGKGHAHLYIDGAYVSEFTSGAQTLPALTPGNHEVMVGLNSIDHRAFATEGRVVGDRIVVRVPDPRRRASVGAATSFAIDLKGGRVAGENTVRVKQNETIRLQWTSDAPIVLHLEGYDIEAQVTAQTPVSMLFVADAAGRFPVEEHGQGGAHGRGALYYVEVYP
jgi:hypothetical protein